MGHFTFLRLMLVLAAWIMTSPGAKAVHDTLPPHLVAIGKGYDIASATLGQTRRINVYLPPGYEATQKAYPLLVMLDGGVKEDFIHMAGIASLAADYRNIREFILVGIENIDRYHDLIHPSNQPITRERLKTAGGSAKFRQFIRTELLPFITSRFRVTEQTALIGESAAGMFTLETMLKEPDLFQGYIAISPMLWWDDQSLAKEAERLLKANPPARGTRLFLTIANEGGEMREGVDMVADALRSHAPGGLSWTYSPMEEETHGTIFHPAALRAVRLFFATE